jgi:Conjugal transfer protein TraD
MRIVLLSMEKRRRAQVANARKSDTYQKIMLGGLVVKAGLREVSATELLGLLVDGRARLDDPVERERLIILGRNAFAA